MTTTKGLQDLKVVFFESRHAHTLGQLISLQGGRPQAAPALREIPLEENRHVFAFAEELFAGKIDVLIFLTGVGTRALLTVLETRYPKEKILEAWRSLPVVARGPKPVRVLDEFKVPVTVKVPEPNTWHEILNSLDEQKDKVPVKGKRVAVQEYGVPNDNLTQGLKQRGAHVVTVPVYRWDLPEDTGPLKKAIKDLAAGKADVAIFTTAVQIVHVLKVARLLKLEDALKRAFPKMAVASIGPDCTESLNANGVHVDIQPEISKMAPFIQETARQAKRVLESKRK